MSSLIPKAPKPDPNLIAAQKAQLEQERQRQKAIKEQMAEATKKSLTGTGIRSFITSSGSGFGRNFTV